MKKILRVLCVALATSFCFFVGCNKPTDKTEDSSPHQSEESIGENGIELPDVEL
ncbi:MAG: hypothetical protein IJX30_02445 [Clostridia bacterium]|nr:hypothetical protein [Clostridia bacterium]